MLSKKMSLLSFFTVMGSICFAQNQRLKIGDPMPDYVLSQVLNSEKPDVHLAELRGKHVILDFWNTKCLSCLKSFPDIDSLQAIFANDLQFILVNKEDKKFTKQFFRSKPFVHKPSVPMATGAGNLLELFPKDGYPYSVWIDDNGVIRQMAHTYNITAEHIRRFIKGEYLDINNAAQRMQYGSILTVNQESVEANVQYLSCLTKCIQGVRIEFRELAKFTDSLIELAANCSSVVELYQRAFAEGRRYSFDTHGGVVFVGNIPGFYSRPTDPNKLDAWSREHSYNYELILPKERSGDAYRIMQEDLERNFRLKGRVIVSGDKHILVLKE